MPARSATGAKRMRFSGEVRSWLDTGYLDVRGGLVRNLRSADCSMIKIVTGSTRRNRRAAPRAGDTTDGRRTGARQTRVGPVTSRNERDLETSP
ncbi:hypothetical protein GCM10009627_21740 [Curtobacterium herbarum]|uniref:Uncharacterized protein n=1 Tax=Curtobacterium herbarum TaxID=150122 RepID=A0ABN1ZE21_9MICO